MVTVNIIDIIPDFQFFQKKIFYKVKYFPLLFFINVHTDGLIQFPQIIFQSVDFLIILY